ncbi:heparan-sulfate 6-O-sulfotransferase 1-B-like [Dendronephthya gigantea]|uniref:heparan-sulfate 6-O-sulfotransferase 1-B-like n=1 Tax=Dendronephthya gigantea TaxID=151771 RepID=UPI00106BDEC8|nr:heparan-sulfate 6-O-sulfotransferase 1-B-like [Dendronephthya gigantea]
MFNQKVLVLLIIVTAVICLAYCINLFYFSSGLVQVRPISYESPILQIRRFEINGHDIMVFLHMQKTGGTSFGKNLVRNLRLERTCHKVVSTKSRFMCKRPNSDEFWLYSRYSTGWICGLHADWTTWTSCLPNVLKQRLSKDRLNKTKIFYITLLRDPVDRFLSEFKHVQRGATWISSKFICNNKPYNPPVCFKGANWSNVKLSEFLNCPYNLAFNRQTRMLANLTEIGCHNNDTKNFSKQYGKAMLESAKRNLRSMAYFGLVEYQRESQYLFEKTFGLKFKKKFSQVPVNETISSKAWALLTPRHLLQTRKVTRLDRQLYSYAKALFFKRLKYIERLTKAMS